MVVNFDEIAEIKSELQYYKSQYNRKHKELMMKQEELRKRNEDNEKISPILSTDVASLLYCVLSLESCFICSVSGSPGMCVGLKNCWTGTRAITIQKDIVKTIGDIEEFKAGDKLKEFSLKLEQAQKVIKVEVEKLTEDIEELKRQIKNITATMNGLESKLYYLM